MKLTAGLEAMENFLLMYRSSSDVFPVPESPTNTNFIIGESHIN